MKKFVALLLAAMMLLGCASALAESTLVGTTSLPFNLEVPEMDGLNLEYEEYEGIGFVYYTATNDEDEIEGTFYLITLANSDDTLLEGADLKDATDDQIEQLYEVIATADGDYTYEVRDLDDDVKVIIIVDQTLLDAVQVITIKDGVFVNVSAYNADLSAVNDEVIENCVKLMDALKFVEKEAPEATTTPAA